MKTSHVNLGVEVKERIQLDTNNSLRSFLLRSISSLSPRGKPDNYVLRQSRSACVLYWLVSWVQCITAN